MIQILKLRINPFLDSATVRHISTDYVIATDEDMTNIVDESYNNPSLDIYYSPMSLIEGVTYYGTAKRNLVDENDIPIITQPIGPKNLTAIYDGRPIENVPEIAVDIPYPIIDLESLYSPTEDSFIITVEDIRADGVGCDMVTWIVKDELNKILFRSLNDTANLTSISVPKEKIQNANVLHCYVAQRTNNSIYSLYGHDMAYANAMSYTVVSNLINVPFDIDYLLKLESLNSTELVPVDNISVIDTITNKVVYSTDTRYGNGFKIPNAILAPDVNYMIEIKLEEDKVGSHNTVYRHILQVAKDTQKFLTDTRYVYEDTVTIFGTPPTFYIKPISGNIEVSDEIVLLDASTNAFKFYDLSHDINQFNYKGTATFTGNISLAGSSYKMVNISNTKIALYGLSGVTEVMTLWLLTIDRKHESIAILNEISFSGTIDNYGVDTFTYTPGDEYLYLITKDTNGTTQLNTINIYNGNTVQSNTPVIGNNVVLDSVNYEHLHLISTDEGSVSYTYKRDKGKWTEAIEVPYEFIDREIKSVITRDGNVLYVATDGEDSFLFKLNTVNQTYEVLETARPGTPVDSVIRLKNGNILIMNNLHSFLYK